jgi:hypothetical protein
MKKLLASSDERVRVPFLLDTMESIGCRQRRENLHYVVLKDQVVIET